MKSLFLTFSMVFCLLVMGMGRQIYASDQKLAHGAGTLPHLTSAATLSVGFEMPTPIVYALRYDIGLGNRVQLGISASAAPFWFLGFGMMFGIEVHSMFNVLKTSSDSDFLSLYVNPGIVILNDFFAVLIGPNNMTLFLVRPGIAYEHRFGSNRRIGVFVKMGILLPVGAMGNGDFAGGGNIGIDCRAGFQALLGKRFSLVGEPMVIFGPSEPVIGGKGALTWAF
jgi:hypothetical protein